MILLKCTFSGININGEMKEQKYKIKICDKCGIRLPCKKYVFTYKPDEWLCNRCGKGYMEEDIKKELTCTTFEEACKISSQNAAIRYVDEDTIVCCEDGTCLVTECNSYKCNYEDLPKHDDWLPLPDKP